MNLELHLIQNFAPSSLNRSDTGSPKDCEFGGFRRARISSQCFKRAMREYFRSNFEMQDRLAERSIRLIEEIARQLASLGRDLETARKVARVSLESLGLKTSKKDPTKTEYLLFMGRDEIKGLVEVCNAHFEALSADKIPDDTTKAVKKALLGVMNEGKAADLALFGRMLADLPERNRDASSQVAHAISTHKVGMEFDFFTAVDDLRPEDTSGSDHLGTIEFNSACFYRYANLNVDKLRENLGDDDLTRATVVSFIRAAIQAIPTGKQNTFATHEKPSFVLATVDPGSKNSLANAFEKPVRATERKGLVEGSVERFAQHWAAVAGVYGDGTKAKFLVTTAKEADLGALKDADVGNVETLINKTMTTIFG